VVIDTFGRAVAGDENDADTFRGLYRNTGLHLKQAGIAFIRLDHAGKDVEKGQRGSSAKNDDVDVVFRMIRRDDQALRVTATHRRMAWVPQETDIAVIDEDGVTRFSTGAGSWPEGTKTISDALDDAGAPVDVTWRRAQEILRDAGVKARTATIRAAIKHRRQSVENLVDEWVPNVGTHDPEPMGPKIGTHRDPKCKTPSQRPDPLRDPSGPIGRPRGSHMGPPIGGPIDPGGSGSMPKPGSWLIGEDVA